MKGKKTDLLYSAPLDPPTLNVDVGGVGAALTVATICTLCIGIGVGFIFGMNVYGCPWIMDRSVVNDVCQCPDDVEMPEQVKSPSSALLSVISDIGRPPKVGLEDRHGCTLMVLLAKQDGTRSWVDTLTRCTPRGRRE